MVVERTPSCAKRGEGEDMRLGAPWKRQDDALSLRLRLIGLVVLVFVLSLALGGTVACLNASRSVEAEMQAALAVARQTIEAETAVLGTAAEPWRDLVRLVGSFHGNRHLRVGLSGGDRAAVSAAPAPPTGRAPPWFLRLIDGPPSGFRLPVAVGDGTHAEISVETVPDNEISEIWHEFGDSLLILGLFSLPTLLLIYVFIGRALRPLERLALALGRIGEGDYAVRLDDRLPPELSRLRDRFNRTAVQLAGMAAENRRLNEQLLSLQEQERSELARDLHDDVGPFLFAIKVDAANIGRHLREGRVAAIADHAAAIAEAVGHVQQQVKSMLARLRPIGLAEFGLADAIANLAEFWRRRHPEIDYRLEIAAAARSYGDLVDTAVYRVVQEGLSNALRHTRPSLIKLRVDRARDDGRDALRVIVADDGAGMAADPVMGYGLLGMSERVKAMGGSLTVSSATGEGVTLTALIPLAGRAGATFNPVSA